MKTLAWLAVLAFSFSFHPPLPNMKFTLNEAVEKGYVGLEALGEGGHSGECLKVRLKNLYRKDLEIVVPAGQVFEAGDSSLQDLMVAKEETFLVQKGKTRAARLYGYCVEAGDGSPGVGTGFRLGKMAVGNLLAFAQYLSLNNLHKNPSVQNAIWAISDDERLESIGDPALAKHVADLLGKPVPEYNIEYRQPDRSRILESAPVRDLQEAFSMNGLFYFTLEEDRLVNFEIYTEEGEFVHAFYKNRKKTKGYHKFRFEFEIRNLPKGKYFVRMTGGGEVIKELAVEF